MERMKLVTIALVVATKSSPRSDMISLGTIRVYNFTVNRIKTKLKC